MGLGRTMTRSTVITSKNTVTGATATFTINDGIAPDWASSDAYRGGMTIPGAWRAAGLIAAQLGGMPWDAFREFGGNPIEKIKPRPPLLEQPNPPDPRVTTMSSLVLDKLWHGNAISVVAARDRAGWPTAAIPVPAECVGVRRVTPYVDSPLPVGSIEYEIGSMRLGSADVIHVKGPCRPGAVRGMGVLELHFETLNLAKTQQRQAGSISQHGVPTGVLESSNPDLTEAEAADLKTKWLASQGSRTVAVLNATTKFTPLSWNPEEMQMIEARKFTLNELELIFGLPVGWLGGTDSSRKYSNMSQDDLALLKWTFGEHITVFEQVYTLAFPRGTEVKANLDAFLRADTLTRYQAHAIALDKGFRTVDEVRELEDLPPLPEPPPPDPALLPPIQAQAQVGAPPAIEPRRRLPFDLADNLRYSDDQPRDENGRFGEGGGGGGSSSGKGGGKTGQAALDATPATLVPGERGHFGNYEGESLSGPPGMGSVRALSEYEGVEYDVTNGNLRHGPLSERIDNPSDDIRARDAEIAARIADIDQTMSASRLTHDVQVERGVGRGGHVFGDAWHEGVLNKGTTDFDEQDREYERWQAGDRPDLTGMRFRDAGYTSTSADPRVAEQFVARRAQSQQESMDSEGEPVVMKIQVPAGTGAVQMGTIAPPGAPLGRQDSAEILLERGLTYEVTADHGIDDMGIRRLDVAVVPNE